VPDWIRWEDWIKQEEEQQERACIECAQANGYSIGESLGCEDGHLNCKGCPWGGSEK